MHVWLLILGCSTFLDMIPMVSSLSILLLFHFLLLIEVSLALSLEVSVDLELVLLSLCVIGHIRQWIALWPFDVFMFLVVAITQSFFLSLVLIFAILKHDLLFGNFLIRFHWLILLLSDLILLHLLLELLLLLLSQASCVYISQQRRLRWSHSFGQEEIVRDSIKRFDIPTPINIE